MKLTGGQIIVRYLEKEKIPYVLGIPGHGILGFFDALRESEESGNVKYIQVKHEQSAVHIADGYFRIKGEPLAVFTSIGPGAINTAVGLATAYVDSSAVFEICGDTHVHMKGVGVLQEIEQYQDSNFIRIMEPITKRAWRAESVGQLARLMQRSFNQMLTGRTGPVMISLPMNVQSDSVDVELPEPAMHRPLAKPAGSKTQISQAVKLMKAARRPVILAGGAVLRANVEEKLVHLAELWGAAVVTTMAGKSAFPEDHPLYGFHTGSKGTTIGLELTSKADVILALGTRFADETASSYMEGISFSSLKTKLIQVDIDPKEIGKNYACDIGILGDVDIVIGQLIDEYESNTSKHISYKNNSYTMEIESLKKEWKRIISEKRSVKYDKITISQLIGELNECLPDNTIIVTSSGNTQAQLFQEYCFTNGQKCLTTGGFSTMGWAMPAAIGAKLAKPDNTVVALIGDGDFMMTMQELSVMAQYNIPVIVIVANNSGWIAIKDLQADVFGQDYMYGNDFMRGDEIYSPDYAGIAKAFGIYSEKISQRGELKALINRLIDMKAPVLIEVEVHREYPESGGKAYGWWDVPIPEYMTERRQKYLNELEDEIV